MRLYTTGELSKIIGAPMWRLQSYFDSPRFGINYPVVLGKGRGSRRMFTVSDIHFLAIVNDLVKFGFECRAVAAIMPQLKNKIHCEKSGWGIVSRKLNGLRTFTVTEMNTNLSMPKAQKHLGGAISFVFVSFRKTVNLVEERISQMERGLL